MQEEAENRVERPPLSWLGTSFDKKEALVGTLGALVISLLYQFVATRAFNTPVSQLELWSLVSSLACVWLTRTENVWSMPLGIISCVLMGWFFLDISLVGQGWLQLAFYIPVQVVGWWAWCRGGVGFTELPPTRLKRRGWVLSVVLGLVCWGAVWALFYSLYGSTLFQGWDTSVVAASIIAQFLLTFKKAEHWLLWLVPVNVSAIFLYAATGAWSFSFLYVVYLFNAWSGWKMWLRVMDKESL